MKSPLIKSAQSGDTAALNQLLLQYRDTAYSIAIRILGNGEDAEDVVQDSYVSIFKSIRKFRNESQFSTWLYRIVYNESIRARKKHSQLLISDTPDDNIMIEIPFIDDALQRLVSKERDQRIREAMDQLHENESLILTLFYLEEKSIKEIQQITDFSKPNIKVILHRARKNLYTVLTKLLHKERGD